MRTCETTYLGLPFADAYMRSRWVGGGDGKGVTLLGCEEEDGKKKTEEGQGEIAEKRRSEVSHS